MQHKTIPINITQSIEELFTTEYYLYASKNKKNYSVSY